MTETIRSIYAHTPFCHTICGYCDFYSVVYDKAGVGPLVDALMREIDQAAARHAISAETIFVGGGTPTALPAHELARLLTRLREFADPAARLEFTCEANPATVTPEIATALASAGVTRVSVGAQSFEPGELRVLDRIHHPQQVAQTLETCRRAGIAQLNLDLIFAIPGQSLEAWLANLRRAIELGPDHLSCYGLTYEPGTPLYDRLKRGAIERVDSDLEADMYEATIDTLAGAGYAQYEISNFARPGCECRHNLGYWRNDPYLGVGPSASGFVEGARYKNVPDTHAYVAAMRAGSSPRVQEERLTLDARARETMMLELRLLAGVDRARFARRFGADPAERFMEAVTRHQRLGLMRLDEDALRLTRRGLLLADSVIAEYL